MEKRFVLVNKSDKLALNSFNKRFTKSRFAPVKEQRDKLTKNLTKGETKNEY